VRIDPVLTVLVACSRLLPVLAVVAYVRGARAVPLVGLGVAAWALSSAAAARTQTVQARARDRAVADGARVIVARAPTRVGAAHQDALLARLLRAMYARVRRASETQPTLAGTALALPIALGALIVTRGAELPLAALAAGAVGVLVRVPLARRHRAALDDVSARHVALNADLHRGVRALEDLRAHGLEAAFEAHDRALARAVADAEARAARAALVATWMPLGAATATLGALLLPTLLGPRNEAIVTLVTLATLAPSTVAFARAWATDAVHARDVAPLDRLLAAGPDLPPADTFDPPPASLFPVTLEHVRHRFEPPAPDVAAPTDAPTPSKNPWVLDDVSLHIAGDAPVVIVGPNGSGKSTLLSILLRLDDPGEGAVRFGGVDVRRLDPAAFRARLAVVTQRPLVLGDASVADALRMVAADATDEALRHALVETGLHERLARRGDPLTVPAASLSVGESRRLALARALLRQAELWVLDEPEAGLDPEGRVALKELLDRQVAAGVRLVLAVQHLEVAPTGAVVVPLPLAPGSSHRC
jgi:ABC-type multidrug transport system fused ATPase/permease subunit